MTRRPHLVLALLPLLLAAWVACPCVYSQWIAQARGADAAAPGESSTSACTLCACCCCGSEDQLALDGEPNAPHVPKRCERKSARQADLPPAPITAAAPDLTTLVAVLDDEAEERAGVVTMACEVLPAPPDVLRRGTVLLR